MKNQDDSKEVKYFNQKKYDKKNTTQFRMKLNNNTDKDILDWLSNQPNKQGAVKSLIRKELERTKNDKSDNWYNFFRSFNSHFGANGNDLQRNWEEVKTIKEAATAVELTQEKISEMMGIPKRTIENWEGRKRIIRHLQI